MQKQIIGRNKIYELNTILDTIKANKVIFFHGKKSFNAYKSMIETILCKYDVTFYSDFDVNPKYEQIVKAIEFVNKEKYDVIIGMGGGSVIDFAKSFRFYTNIKIPLIAVPTTAGTGSEATQFAVVYKNGIKTSLDDSSILPNYVILDSQFASNAPQYIKACSAADAYCQAIESYWSVLSTAESQKYAKQAIQLIKDNIEKFVLSSDKNSVEKMLLGAFLSGKAINISRTTAAHALSYNITTKYGIPHGHAVALSIANLLIENMKVDDNNCNDARGSLFVKEQISNILNFIGLKSPQEFLIYWRNLMLKIGLETDTIKLGIKDKLSITQNVNLQRLANNPVLLSINNLTKLFR